MAGRQQEAWEVSSLAPTAGGISLAPALRIVTSSARLGLAVMCLGVSDSWGRVELV